MKSVKFFQDKTGTVFRDFNANGTKDNSATFNEPFVQGVTVTAFPTSGTSQTVTTNSNGAYSFTGLTLPVRIEFSGFSNGDFSGPVGIGNNSSVQFYATPNSTANFGINYPIDYIGSTNPNVATTRFCNGSLSSVPPSPFLNSSILTFKYNNNGVASIGNGNLPSEDASKQSVGSVWGLAYHRNSKKLFSSALVKRHVSLKDGKKGAIYVVDYSYSPPIASLFVDLEAAPYNLNLGSFAGDETSRGLAGIGYLDRNLDKDAFVKTGRVGLGGLTISDANQRYLYTTNLSTGKLIKIDLGTDINNPTVSSVNEYSLPSISVTNGELRSFAVKFYKGKVYVGAVASGEYETGTSNANLFAYVFQFDPVNNTFNPNPIITIPMNTASYPKGYADYAPSPNVISQWYPWSINTNDFNSNFYGSDCVVCRFKIRPQPQFGSIEFGEDGSMIMSFIDRAGNQLGYENDNPDNTSIGSPDNALYNGVISGDILRATPISNGTYTLENNGVSGGLNGGVANGQGPAGGEFFYGEYFRHWNGSVDGHQETVTGGIAYFPGKYEVIANNMDVASFFTSGSRKFSNINGSRTDGQGYTYDISAIIDTINFTPPVRTGGMGKVVGLGDLEILSDPAPIEIGNRVWLDIDNDGIQDAGEAALPGVIVQLLKEDGTLVATATTDANGNYIFSSAAGTSSNAFIYGLTILQQTKYIVRIPNVQGGSKQVVIGSNVLTTVNSDNSINGDVRDSDGSLVGNNADVTITTGIFGENNHTFDFGFSNAPSCTVSATCSATPQSNCSPINGSANVTVSGAQGNVSYLWSSGETTASISNKPAGTYTVIVTDDFSVGCNTTCQAIISNNTTPPTLSCSKVDNTNCATPNGTATATASGVTYLWNNGATMATITGLNAGTYTVTVTSTTNSCTSTCSAIVANTSAPPTLSCSKVDNTNCATPNGTATATASGVTYLWSNGATTATITGLNAGTYTVTVTSTTNSCTSTCSAIVANTSAPPTVSCSKVDNTNCATPNGTATATASGVTYLWSNGATTATITGLNAGTYTVTVTNTTSLCTSTCSVIIQNSTSPPSITCTPTQPTCLTQNGGSVSTTVTGGILPLNYIWSNGATSAINSNIGAGTYTVTVTDNNSCTATCSAVLNAPLGCCEINNLGLVIGNCNNKGTLTIAADDEFTFSLNPTGTGIGSTYTVNGLPNSPQTGTYGSPTTFGPYLISAGVLNISVVDNVSNTCSKTASVTPPPSCSVCNVNPPVLSVNDNICPSRTGSINLVQGCGAGTFIQYSTNNGASWSIVKPLYSTTPLLILARCVNSIDTTCKSPNTTVTTAPKKCPNSGNECTLTANATIDPCNNNGTDDIASDDYFTIQVNATVANGGSNNKYEVVIGADPLTGIGGNVLNSGGTNYGSPVTVGNTKIFMANGTSSYQLIIRDINNNNCFQIIDIQSIKPCSIAPPKSPCYPVPCVPIGLIKN